MKEKILPCKCGNTEYRVKWHVGVRLYKMWCTKCLHCVDGRSKKYVIDSWNRINERKQ